MKLLVTGAGGQLGREWMHYLDNSPHNGIGFNSTELDITNKNLVKQKVEEIRPDVLINCAAYTAVDDAEDNHEKAFKINKTGVANLAEICRQAGVKLIHYSTDYVFEGSEKDRNELPEGYTEDHPPDPQNVYGASKLAGEREVEKVDGDWIIIRVSWLCGRFGSNFVKTMLRLANEKKELKIVNDQIGSPTFCTDLVEKTMALVEMDQKGYFHVSSRGAISWYELTHELLKRIGKTESVKLNPVSSAEFAAKAKRPAFSLLNCSKIESLGLETTDWKDGLNVLIRQLKN